MYHFNNRTNNFKFMYKFLTLVYTVQKIFSFLVSSWCLTAYESHQATNTLINLKISKKYEYMMSINRGMD